MCSMGTNMRASSCAVSSVSRLPPALTAPARQASAAPLAAARHSLRLGRGLMVLAEAPAGEPVVAAAAAAAPVPTPTSAASPAPATFDIEDLHPQPATNGKGFVWTRNWYPVTALDNLHPSRPTQIMVLGYNLAVWRDAGGEWRAFRDACPHRAAPLSEGRINRETKNLECAYHGWQFAGSGAAVELPQSQPGAAKATACSSGRSCAVAYPTAESHGLLWVWLEPGAAGRSAAAAAPLPVLPTTDQEGREWFQVSPWYVRDLDVDHLPLMENSCDPAHVHFTHAGFIGARDRAGPINVKLLDQEDGVYTFVSEDPKKASFRNLVLKPPCMLWASSEGTMPGGELALLYFVVPVAPGKSRLMSLVFSSNKKVFGLLAKIFHWQPWLRHLYNHTVAAQDVAVLHRQGTNMAAPDWPGWRKGFYLPTSSDSGVVVMRKWLEQVAGGRVAWGPNVSASDLIQPETRREVLMDTYHQHTEHCPHCQKALRGVRAGAAAMAAAAGAAFLGLAYAWGQGGVAPLAPASLALLAGLGLALAARDALQKLERKFYFADWRHADHSG